MVVYLLAVNTCIGKDKEARKLEGGNGRDNNVNITYYHYHYYYYMPCHRRRAIQT
jgi:hypothetical protein